MRLKKGNALYKFPKPYSQILDVRIEGKHNQMIDYPIQIVAMGTLPFVAVLGLPMYCAIYKNKIEFSPPPDKAYLVKVRYLPPIKEF